MPGEPPSSAPGRAPVFPKHPSGAEGSPCLCLKGLRLTSSFPSPHLAADVLDAASDSCASSTQLWSLGAASHPPTALASEAALGTAVTQCSSLPETLPILALRAPQPGTPSVRASGMAGHSLGALTVLGAERCGGGDKDERDAHKPPGPLQRRRGQTVKSNPSYLGYLAGGREATSPARPREGEDTARRPRLLRVALAFSRCGRLLLARSPRGSRALSQVSPGQF